LQKKQPQKGSWFLEWAIMKIPSNGIYNFREVVCSLVVPQNKQLVTGGIFAISPAKGTTCHTRGNPQSCYIHVQEALLEGSIRSSKIKN
jgi:hypothetical protein